MLNDALLFYLSQREKQMDSFLFQGYYREMKNKQHFQVLNSGHQVDFFRQ